LLVSSHSLYSEPPIPSESTVAVTVLSQQRLVLFLRLLPAVLLLRLRSRLPDREASVEGHQPRALRYLEGFPTLTRPCSFLAPPLRLGPLLLRHPASLSRTNDSCADGMSVVPSLRTRAARRDLPTRPCATGRDLEMRQNPRRCPGEEDFTMRRCLRGGLIRSRHAHASVNDAHR
jgi:hypothetical protein